MMHQLNAILQKKEQEVATLKALIAQQPNHPIADILSGKIKRNSAKHFKQSLQTETLAVIGEIKRKSPSKGLLASITDPVMLVEKYIQGDVNAISILTDQTFFNGSCDDLRTVSQAILQHPQAILQKDFIIDDIQIAQAIHAGADAILCIVLALGEKTQQVIHSAKRMGIDVLVEVGNRAELEIALSSGADMIAVNNRDLSTFQVDDKRALTLIHDIPTNIVKVAASGILHPALARQYAAVGYDAVLVGEALVTSADPAAFIRACRYD